MKRIIISISIMALIVAVGVAALITAYSENDRLYGKIESVVRAYESGGDVSKEIEALKKFFKQSYAPALGAFVDDETLGELLSFINRLAPMYESGCDEFTAECEALRTEAEKIYLGELPSVFRIL